MKITYENITLRDYQLSDVEDELYYMIDLAYNTVLNSFSKKVQKEILSREK